MPSWVNRHPSRIRLSLHWSIRPRASSSELFWSLSTYPWVIILSTIHFLFRVESHLIRLLSDPHWPSDFFSADAVPLADLGKKSPTSGHSISPNDTRCTISPVNMISFSPKSFCPLVFGSFHHHDILSTKTCLMDLRLPTKMVGSFLPTHLPISHAFHIAPSVLQLSSATDGEPRLDSVPQAFPPKPPLILYILSQHLLLILHMLTLHCFLYSCSLEIWTKCSFA